MLEAISIFTLGLANSAATCSFSCMIYLTPFLIDGVSSVDGKKYQGLKRGIAFFAGKSSLYIITSLISAIAGMQIETCFKTWGKWISGIALILAGLISIYLFSLQIKNKTIACRTSRERKLSGLFFLGASTSAVFCPAVIFLTGVSITSGSAWMGALYGFLFSLGTAISPALIYAVMGVEIGKALKENSRNFYRILVVSSRLMLVGLGLKTILS